MPRIAFIGAGSTVFTRNLVGDLLAQPELEGSTFALMDVDPRRLETSRAAVERLAAAHASSAAVEATLDRRAALEGADYVVTSFQVGGLESTLIDFEVPKRYGLRQTIGDTLGVGGISRALRTIPVLLDVCRDMEALCPDALLLQYVNPMAMLCWAVAEASPIRTVGLCHSVQHTTGELAADLGVPAEEIDAHVAGINHLAFFLTLERGGEDLYPALRAVDAAGGQPRALRGAAPPRSVRHRVLGALRRVRAVVHQGRPPRADRALRHPARRVRAPPARGGGPRTGTGPPRSPAATSTAPTSCARARPASRSASTAT